MKPRRENGAALVRPTAPGVIVGSARMGGPPFWGVFARKGARSRRLGRRIQQTIAAKGKSPACEVLPDRVLEVGWGRSRGDKKQGRRRNIPSTTLPAPDIEIGSRHPVNCSMPRIRTGICEADH